MIDHRALNKKTLNNCYPLPHIDYLFDLLAYASVISSPYVTQGYHYFHISKEDAPKTTLRTMFWALSI